MNKFKKLLALLVVSPLFLGSCVRNNGYCYCDEKTVKDENDDGICDICGLPIAGYCHHEDADGDGYCDICGHDMNTPEGGDDDSGSGGSGGGDQGGGDQGGGGSGGGGDSGGGGGDVTPVNPPVDPNVEVTTYLVLSSVGLYKGEPGMTVGAKHLEYTIAFVALPGAALPGASDVTHSYGSATFSRWLCYEGNGAPTAYTKVPYANEKILYAEFVANGNDPVEPDPIDDPVIPELEYTTYYLNTSFSDGSGGNWDIPFQQTMWAYVWNSQDNRAYEMTWDHDTIWKVDIPKDTYNMVIFCRLTPDATTFAWDDRVYNQTIDLAFVAGKTTAQIENWGAGASPVHWVS